MKKFQFIPIIKHNLKYNPSLDGIRGIAVTLVLLFHIWPEYFSFGYVGVDIFFVLSGFLITQIIYTKLEQNNFSFKEFYRNRIRRIFPALLLVLSAALIVGYLFMFPMELKELGKHVMSTSFFYENFRLISEIGYWDEAAVLKPLLHTWSLAIEEQFYIFWPLMLWLLYRTRVNQVLTLFMLSLFLFLIPLIFEIDRFYHTFSRVWELSFGGLAFIIFYKYKNINELLDRYKVLIYLAFFISILISYKNTSFNTFKTFIVVFSSSLLILSLADGKSKKTIFSNKILVFIGLISYPLYLWHYLLISFTHIFGYELNQILGISIIFVSLLLSYFTYRFIEYYARSKNSFIFAYSLIIMIVCIGFLGNYIYKKDGFPHRSHLKNEKYEYFEKQLTRLSAKNDLGISLLTKILGYQPINDYIKSTSDDINKKFILITGDSHAHTSYPGFAKEFKKYGYETILLANSSCPPYYKGAMGKNINDLNKCKEKINTIYRLINSNKIILKKVILTTRMAYMYDMGFGKVDGGGKPFNNHFESYYVNQHNYDQKQKFFEAIVNTFSYFEKERVKFYYLMDNPELGFSPKSCLPRPLGLPTPACRITLDTYLKRAGEYREFIYKISTKYRNISILDPKNLFCDDKYCYAIRYGKLMYADDDHHSVDGSILQAKFFIHKIISEEAHNDVSYFISEK